MVEAEVAKFREPAHIVAHISVAIAYRIDLIYLLLSFLIIPNAFEVGLYEADTNNSYLVYCSKLY
jgi:hypothetical protein